MARRRLTTWPYNAPKIGQRESGLFVELEVIAIDEVARTVQVRASLPSGLHRLDWYALDDEPSP